MQDLIDRQAAIDAIKKDIMGGLNYESILMDLPPAQPTQPNASNVLNALDCISRQAAIDIVVFESGKWTGLAKEISNQLKRLPSAQPEIIACDDCKYADDKPISDGRYWCSIHGSFMYYCSDAERREE